MATATGLMNLGQPAELAKRTGVSVVSVTTSGTPTQLRGPGNLAVLVTVTVAAQSVLLPNNADTGDVVEIYNVGANSLDILPQVGGFINNGLVNAAFARAGSGAVTTNTGVHFRKVSATHWRTTSA